MPLPLDRSVVTTDNDAVGERVHDVDDEMAALAKTVATDVGDLLDVPTEYVASRFEYDAESHEKTAVVRLDVGLADELRGRYDGVKLGDSGEVELHLTVDADRA
jgi:hypothetical protein